MGRACDAASAGRREVEADALAELPMHTTDVKMLARAACVTTKL